MSEATLSGRGRAMAQISLRARLQPLLSNIYHPQDNPNGIVDMGTAENHIMTKDVSDFANTKIRTNPRTFTYGEEYLHVVYGMSKDFAAGGLRLGCLYSRNKALMDAVTAVSQFSWSGPLSQFFATQMLGDEDWKTGFLVKSKKVLKERYERCTHILDDYEIEYSAGSNAGFFLWANFHPFLDIPAYKDERAAEDTLAARMEHNGVYITKGSLLQADQAGWFRIIFAQEDDIMEEGLKRLFNAIGVKKVKSE